jgi:hypothetical protein
VSPARLDPATERRTLPIPPARHRNIERRRIYCVRTSRTAGGGDGNKPLQEPTGGTIKKNKRTLRAGGARPREAPVAAARGRRHRSRTCPSRTGLAGAAGRGGWLLGQVNTAGSEREVGDEPQEARACPSTCPRGEHVKPTRSRFPRRPGVGTDGCDFDTSA